MNTEKTVDALGRTLDGIMIAPPFQPTAASIFDVQPKQLGCSLRSKPIITTTHRTCSKFLVADKTSQEESMINDETSAAAES